MIETMKQSYARLLQSVAGRYYYSHMPFGVTFLMGVFAFGLLLLPNPWLLVIGVVLTVIEGWNAWKREQRWRA
jgi:hypothetical protein